MNTEALETPAREPTGFDLVSATESGAFFTDALAPVLRVVAFLGFVPVLAALVAAGQVGPDASSVPMIVVAIMCALAGWLGLKVLFARAGRLEKITGERFPVALVVRECVRAFAEVVFVWSMTVGTVGWMAMVWETGRVDVASTWVGLATAGGIAIGGGVFLIAAHLWTEIAAAITVIASKTSGAAAAEP